MTEAKEISRILRERKKPIHLSVDAFIEGGIFVDHFCKMLILRHWLLKGWRPSEPD